MLQIIDHEGVAIDWNDIRHGRRQLLHHQQLLQQPANREQKPNRWKRRAQKVKEGDLATIRVNPEARRAYMIFLGLYDLTDE